MPSSTFDYTPDRVYTLDEFEGFNSWLKTHDLVINEAPISHFERDAKGRLIPMPQTPIGREAAVSEITGQLRNWNVQTQQNGVVTSSQGGFKLPGGIVAPDVAFTPKQIYRQLTQQQQETFQGPAFCPTFVVEVETLSARNNFDNLTAKFKETYFPAGVKLGWLVDPLNRTFYVFTRDRDNTVRRRQHQWVDDNNEATVVPGLDVLPGFQLKLWRIDEVLSQVCFVSFLLQQCSNLSYELATGIFGVGNIGK